MVYFQIWLNPARNDRMILSFSISSKLLGTIIATLAKNTKIP